ncbi:MAG: hypothetical protein AAFQ10_07435 [Pseudomonadota bacterium]
MATDDGATTFVAKDVLYTGLHAMSEAEQRLADDKMRAEIAKLLAESKQVTVNTFLVPFLAAAGFMGATAALVKGMFG